MSYKGKVFVASYSGGKDSVLAVHRAIEAGMAPLELLTTYNADKERSWFHNVIKLRERSQKTHRAGYEQTHTLLFF